MVPMRRSKGSLLESVLSFHHGGPGDQTQMVSIVGKHLYVLSHLSGPSRKFLSTELVLVPD